MTDNLDWKAYYAWKASQRAQLSLKEKVEIISEFDSGQPEKAWRWPTEFGQKKEKGGKDEV